MRFKARIVTENLNILIGVSQACEKIGKRACIFLDQWHMRVAVIEESIDAPKVFVELSQETVFSEYRIESQSQNQIMFEIELDLLSRALSSGKNAPMCDLKLVKRGLLPHLCLDCKALDVAVQHDIPIRVMKASTIVYYQPPDVNPPQVALELPRGRLLRTILDKMSKLTKVVNITAEQTGRLIFSIDHSSAGATIKTYYTKLHPRFEGHLDEAVDGSNIASVKVDIRKLTHALNMRILNYESACVCVTDNDALVLYVTLSPQQAGHVSYFIPVIVMDEHDF